MNVMLHTDLGQLSIKKAIYGEILRKSICDFNLKQIAKFFKGVY